MNRPRLLIGVLGTHTEVGKTWVSSRLLAHARAQGLRVAARKPVQSYDTNPIVTDAQQLAESTGEPITVVCPEHRCYPLALAPPMAADLLKRPRILLQDIVDEIQWPAGVDIGLVETVGGLLSPLAHDGDSVDLITRLQPDRIVLVADAGLGTLNAVRLSLACLAPLTATVMLNRFDAGNELHRLNRAWLTEKYAANVVTTIEELAAQVLAVR
ncbi:dethiobiotin synthase [Povalibacter sp.]|uniref:ATP-dependent dethiobiotin synthetase BioD n=1 Tax=Povalibacter sp. TaxID=1962978 RepID=UPI002F3F1F48